jgi:hypothetical protein
MKRPFSIALVPHVVLALGIIAACLVAVSASGWWVLAGPAVMAAALVGAHVLGHRLGTLDAPWRTTAILAAALMLASAIVGLADTEAVAYTLPILAASVAAPFTSRSCGGCRTSATPS